MTTKVINNLEIGNAFNTYAKNSNCLSTLRYTELQNLSLVCRLFNETIGQWIEKQGGTASASPIWEHFFKAERVAFIRGSFVRAEWNPAEVRERNLKNDFRILFRTDIGNALNLYIENPNYLSKLRYTELQNLSLVCRLFNETIGRWIKEQGGTASSSPIWEHFFKVEGMAFVEGSFVDPALDPAEVRPRDLKSDFRTLFRNAIGITRFSHFGEPVYAYPEGSQKWSLELPSDCVPSSVPRFLIS